MTCEDYPCCGHTALDSCPQRDRKGRIIATCVECGKRLSAKARSSICAGCQRRMAHPDYDEEFRDYPSD